MYCERQAKRRRELELLVSSFLPELFFLQYCFPNFEDKALFPFELPLYIIIIKAHANGLAIAFKTAQPESTPLSSNIQKVAYMQYANENRVNNGTKVPKNNSL